MVGRGEGGWVAWGGPLWSPAGEVGKGRKGGARPAPQRLTCRLLADFNGYPNNINRGTTIMTNTINPRINSTVACRIRLVVDEAILFKASKHF